MDLRQLRYFVAIVDNGSFSKAAQVLGVAQPALSLHVRNMEADFGTSLLFRKSQGVVPTEAGEILLRDARSIIRQFESTRQEIQGFEAEPQGEVRIGMPATLSPIMGVPILLEARKRYPKIKLRIAEAPNDGSILEGLRQGRIDAGLLSQPLNESGLKSAKLLSEHLVLVAGKTHPDGCEALGTTGVSLATLANLPLILLSPGHGLRDFVQMKAAEAGYDLNIVMELDSLTCIRPLVEQGIGYTIMPASLVHQDVRDGRLRTWTIGTPPLRRSIHLLHANDRPLTRVVHSIVSLYLANFEDRVVDSGHKPRSSNERDLDLPALEPSLYRTERLRPIHSGRERSAVCPA